MQYAGFSFPSETQLNKSFTTHYLSPDRKLPLEAGWWPMTTWFCLSRPSLNSWEIQHTSRTGAVRSWLLQTGDSSSLDVPFIPADDPINSPGGVHIQPVSFYTGEIGNGHLGCSQRRSPSSLMSSQSFRIIHVRDEAVLETSSCMSKWPNSNGLPQEEPYCRSRIVM